MQSIREKVGSYTAKGGFENEHDIVAKFNNWQNDQVVQNWLSVLGYDFKKILSLKAVQIPSRISKEKMMEFGVTVDKVTETKKYQKADVQIQVKIKVDDVFYIENISLKKANKGAGFNQIDKRKVETYQSMWGFSDQVASLLKLFTGEIEPSSEQQKIIKDVRRVNFQEMSQNDANLVMQFFKNNKHKIINDVFQGRGALKADWMLVTRKNKDGTLDWLLKDIIEVCNFYSVGEIIISPKGSLKIGGITMQRKGGTPDPTSLQFKCNPLALFEA